MRTLPRSLLLGAAAGAAGTTALNTVSYLDMTWRGRPESSTPSKTVEALADELGTEVPGEDDAEAARTTALGALTGIASGVGVGAAYGLLRGLGVPVPTWLGGVGVTVGALIGTTGPMTLLGVTDPRTWPTKSWVSDIVPHLAYGLVTAATFAAGDRTS